MNLITPTELARLCDITKQAAHKAVNEGLIPFTLQGKKKLIDLDNKSVQSYISDNTRQRDTAKKNDILPSKLPNKKPLKQNKASKLPTGKSSESDEESEFTYTQRKKKADARISEAKASHLEKKLIHTDFVENSLFRYIERLNSNIERVATVTIQESGVKILESGEVLPEHIEMFTSRILEVIDKTKKNIIKELSEYEPI